MNEALISLHKNKSTNYKELNNLTLRGLIRKNSISKNKSNHYINKSTLVQRNGKDSPNLRNLPQLNNKSIYNTEFTSPNMKENALTNSETYKSPVPLKLKLPNKKENLFKIKLPKSTDKRIINFRKNLTKNKIIKPKINTEINNYFNENKKDSAYNLKPVKTEKNQKTIDYDYSAIMKRLDNWDKDHIIKSNNDFFSLYDTLNTYYKQNNLSEEENNLNFADSIVKAKINYNKYKEDKTIESFENKPKIFKDKDKSNEESNTNEQNKGAFLNSLIRNNFYKDTPKNKIDLYNKMMKERLD
jgi:hypothetical protein